MDQSNLVCGVTRIAFDRKGEALETILMEQMELNVKIMALHLFEYSVAKSKLFFIKKI